MNAGSGNIGSLIEGTATHTASKGGLAALTFSTQGTTNASGLRIYGINFGAVETPMIEELRLEGVERVSPERAAEEILAWLRGRTRGLKGRMYPFAPRLER